MAVGVCDRVCVWPCVCVAVCIIVCVFIRADLGGGFSVPLGGAGKKKEWHACMVCMMECCFIFREFGIQDRLPGFGGEVRGRFYWVQVVPFRSMWFILQAMKPFRVVSPVGSIFALLCSCEFAGPKPLVFLSARTGPSD